MDRVGADVDGVAEADVVDFIAERDLALATKHDHDVYVAVMFERGKAARLDLEIAHVKGGTLAAGQRHAAHATPAFAGLLVLSDRNAIPSEARLKPQDSGMRAGWLVVADFATA